MRATRHPFAAMLGVVLGLALPGMVLASAPIVHPAGPAAAAPPTSDEVLVRYRADTTSSQRSSVARDLGLSVVRASADQRTQVVLGVGESAATVRRLLAGDPRVEAVAPNYQRELADQFTDEPAFDLEWGLDNTGQHISGARSQTGIPDVDIDGLEALRITTGSPNVIVAVIDDGVDFSHPDLAARAWTNPGEAGPLATNGIDDDGNGYIDDVHGWDFCNDDNTLHDAGQDGHGTHVAGTIAASLNGTGVVGVAPNIRIMPLKFIDNTHCGSDDMAVQAIAYAASFGVPIINASWGGTSKSSVLDAAISDSNALFVAAAGNAGKNIDSSAYDFYPAESNVANILSVAAIDQRGALASFSNYGSATVDVAAPGTNVISTYPAQVGCPSPCYAWAEGTSMAAPHVSGVAALGLSASPGLTATALKARIMTRGTTLAGVVGKTVTGKLVNALNVVDVIGPTAAPIDRHGINVGSVVGSSLSTTFVWPPATDDHSGVASYVVRRRIGSGSWSILDSAHTTTSFKVSLPLGIATQFGVAGRDGAGNVGQQAESPAVTAVLLQDATSLAHYTGTWSLVTSSTASNGKLHSSTRAGASVEFSTTARAIAVVGRLGPSEGSAKVYVDGVYVKTVDFHRSTSQSRVVVFNQSWSVDGPHKVKVVVVGTAGHPRVDVDAFGVLR